MMRKFLFPGLILCCCALLLAFSEVCAEAARLALSVWWRNVIPSLFPFCVLLSLLSGSEFFPALECALRPAAARLHLDARVLPCFLFGSVAGYPGGAKLCAAVGAPQLAPLCNQCSPAFLLSVVCIGLFRCAALFAPMCIAHYGSALCAALLFRLLCGRAESPAPVPVAAREKAPPLIAVVQSSVLTLCAVGGCIVLFYVLAALLRRTGLAALLALPLRPFGVTEEAVSAVLHGMLEFTGGCAAAAETDLPLRLRFSLCAGFVSFGGLCVWLQSGMFLSGGRGRYLMQKFAQGCIAGVSAYLLFPLFGNAATEAVAQSAEPYLSNAISGGSILFSSCVALLAIYLAGIVLAAKKPAPD